MNPYEVLGVAREAPMSEIKAAYRERVKAVHPDHGGGREEFEQVQLAYEVLRDPTRRDTYDRDGTTTAHASNERAHVIEIVAKMMDEFMGEVANNSHITFPINLVEVMREKIRERIAEGSRHVAKMEGAITRLEKFAQRFSSKGKPFLRLSIEAKVTAMRVAMPIHTKQIDRLEQALELLKDQEFQVDAAQVAYPWNAAQTGGAGGSIFSTGYA